MGWLGGNRESEAETQADRAQRPRHENDVAAESRNEDQQGSTSNDLLIYRSSLFLPERNGLIDRQLCQVVRLVPGAYLEYKAALANECRRQGGLRLAQARALIKIDVNKTRKIYDFLIREGYINKA
ncbi:UNVERIFIED_CONTAM: hypothetical protein FKN15_007195 [Acipenser sinensis]